MITASMPWWLVLTILAICVPAGVVLFMTDPFRRPLPEPTPDPEPAPVDRLLQERLRERFIVTATSGESFDGLLVEVDERTVVLQNVSVLKADGAAMPVDGEVILRRDAVAYMQKP